MSLDRRIYGRPAQPPAPVVSSPPPSSGPRIYGRSPTPSGGRVYGASRPAQVASAYRRVPDDFGAFRPVARTIGDIGSGIGSAIGGALSEARKVPGVEGALTGLSALADATVRTPIGLAALGADTILGTGLTRATQRAAQGRPFYEVPKFASEQLGRAFTKIAEDPRQDALSRIVAQGARVGQVGADVATPLLPGVHVARTVARGAAAGRRTDAVRRLAEARIEPAPVRPTTLYGRGTETELQRAVREGRDLSRSTPAERATEAGGGSSGATRRFNEGLKQPRDPRDLGFGKVFDDLDPDVQDLIRREAIAQGGFTAQRRGVRPIEAIKADAEKAGLTIEDIVSTPAGRAMNAEEMWATVRAVGRAADERRAALDEVAKAGGPQHASTELVTRAVLASVKQASVQRAFAGARTEAGRTLRVLREALSEAEIARTPDAYDRALNIIGGRVNAEQLTRRLVEINARNVPDAVRAADTYRFLRTLGETGRWDKVQEVWLNSILSNPITHEINSISNAVFALTQIPTRFAAAGAEAVTTLGGKTRPREVFFSEAAQMTGATLRGVQTGARKFLHILREGYDISDVQRFVETGRMGRAQAIGGPVGTAINMPTRLLGAEDAFFKGIAQEMEIAAQAARIASREGLKGQAWAARVAELKATPTGKMLDAAARQAKFVTFQSDPGNVTAAIMRLRNQKVAGTSLAPIRFVIPFIQTPSNLVKRGLEYSPAGFIRAARVSGAERSMALGRAAVGSAILSFFASKLLTGEMTAAAPLTPAARDEFYRQGKMPYAMKVGDQWVEYRRLEPAFSFLTMLAGAYGVFQQTGEVDGDTVGQIVGAVGRGISDATYLQGVSNAMGAMEDPARFGDRFVSRLAGGLVPYSGLLRGIAQATDPVIRQPHGIPESIAASLPGLSQNVPARQDVFGREIERAPADAGVRALVDPTRTGRTPTGQDAQVEAEIARVRGKGELSPLGFVGISVGGTKLDREQQRLWQEIAGQQLHRDLIGLFQSSEYAYANDTQKAELIEKTKNKSRKRAQPLFWERSGLQPQSATQQPTTILGRRIYGR